MLVFDDSNVEESNNFWLSSTINTNVQIKTVNNNKSHQQISKKKILKYKNSNKINIIHNEKVKKTKKNFRTTR